jgi:outer membrane protein OmpA-like peptidoglycan-associated protein
LADQETSSTQAVANQNVVADTPARLTQKAKIQPQTAITPAVEKVSVAPSPVVSKRPVRVNLADQDASSTQVVSTQRVVADAPVRTIQKAKIQPQTAITPPVEKVLVTPSPVVSKRPVRVNLENQAVSSSQAVSDQKVKVDVPTRSNQKDKVSTTERVEQVITSEIVESDQAVTKRPIAAAEKETPLARTKVISKKNGEKLSKPTVKSTAELPKNEDVEPAALTPKPIQRQERINLAEQESVATRPAVTTKVKEGMRPRTQVTSSKSLVDDTIVPLAPEPKSVVQQIPTSAKRPVRVNLGEVTDTSKSIIEDKKVDETNETTAPKKKMVSQRIIKTINSRQYIVNTTVPVVDAGTTVISNSEPMKPVSKSVDIVEKSVPVVGKKNGGKSIRQKLPAVDGDGKQIAQLVESDAKPIEKARSIAAVIDFKFGFNSRELLSEESDKVIPLSEILKENGDINLRIVGHTDNVGSLKSNYLLGNKRAMVVKQLFEDQGITDKQLTTVSRAYLEPLAPNVTPKDMAKNRRVEVKVLNQGSAAVENKSIETEKKSVKRNDNSELAVNDRVYNQFIATIEMEKGSRLTLISKKYYGARDFWVYIYEANKEIIPNPDIVEIGTKIRVPKLPTTLIDVNNPACMEKARALHDLYVK